MRSTLRHGECILSDGPVNYLAQREGPGSYMRYTCANGRGGKNLCHNRVPANRTCTLQADGDFVCSQRGVPFWSTGTAGVGAGPWKLALREDGDLVIYDAGGNATWASGASPRPPPPWRRPASPFLTFDRGALRVYALQPCFVWCSSETYRSVWQTATAPEPEDCAKCAAPACRQVLATESSTLEPGQCLRSDGAVSRLSFPPRYDFQRYECTAPGLWKSKTCWTCSANRTCILQADGDLACYQQQARFWSSGTAGQGAGPWVLALEDDGNLAIYDSAGRPTWATNTAGAGFAPPARAPEYLLQFGTGDLPSGTPLVLYGTGSTQFMGSWPQSRIWASSDAPTVEDCTKF